jgi:hypothetical protein
MAGVPVPAYQEFWSEKRSELQAEYKSLVKSHPDAAQCLQQLYKVLSDIDALAGCTPATVGSTEEWEAIVMAAEDNREAFSLALQGKPLYSALYGTYTVTLNDFKRLLKASSQAGRSSQADGFKEVKSRKRHSFFRPTL